MKTNLCITYLLIVGLLFPIGSSAQLISGDVFLQGDYVELGIASNGTLGSGKLAPPSYHSLFAGKTPALLGIVADIDQDGFAVGTPPFIGDYFLPGYPLEAWKIQANGVKGVALRTLGDSSLTGGLTGYNTSYSAMGNSRKATWEGSIGDLKIQQTTSLDVTKMYILFNIKLKNTGTATINDIYYNRLIDPDNEVEQAPVGTSYATAMKIENQIPNIKQQVSVSARGLVFGSYLGLCTRDCRAKAYFLNSGLIANIGLDTIYNGIGAASSYYYKKGDSIYADVGMGLVFKIGSLSAGDSTEIVYAYLLKKTELDTLFKNVFVPHWIFKNRTVAHKDTVKSCDGEVFRLSIDAPGTNNWLWDSSPYLSTTMGAVNFVTAKGTNTYTAIRDELSTCGSSDTLQITAKTVPAPIPLISKSGLLLSVSKIFTAYSWYKGDTALGVYTNNFTVTQNGSYYVLVVDTNGCTVSSDTIYISTIVNGIQHFGSEAGLKIYPNPAQDKISIEAPFAIDVTLMDLSGRVLLQQKNAREINIAPMADGLYLLQIRDAQGQIIALRKLLKQSR